MCRWGDEALDTLRGALVDTPRPPELVAHDFETAACAAHQYGHDELADDITALADHIRANGFTGPWASMAFDIGTACGLT
jgi:hypothetical protein